MHGAPYRTAAFPISCTAPHCTSAALTVLVAAKRKRKSRWSSEADVAEEPAESAQPVDTIKADKDAEQKPKRKSRWASEGDVAEAPAASAVQPVDADKADQKPRKTRWAAAPEPKKSRWRCAVMGGG